MEFSKYNYINIIIDTNLNWDIQYGNNNNIIHHSNRRDISKVYKVLEKSDYIYKFNLNYNDHISKKDKNVFGNTKFKNTTIRLLVVHSLKNIDYILSKFKKVKIIKLQSPCIAQLTRFKGNQKIYINYNYIENSYNEKIAIYHIPIIKKNYLYNRSC